MSEYESLLVIGLIFGTLDVLLLAIYLFSDRISLYVHQARDVAWYSIMRIVERRRERRSK